MNANNPAFARLQGIKIAQSLCGFEYTERHFPSGDFGISRRFGRDFNEQAIISPAFVKLTGGMLEAWTVTQSCWGDGLFCDGASEFCKFVHRTIVARHISIHAYIIPDLNLFEKDTQNV